MSILGPWGLGFDGGAHLGLTSLTSIALRCIH